MCLSTPNIPQDTSAQQAQVQADQRQSQVTQGQQNIDTAFQPFDDSYFNNYTNAYENNYNPQVDDQYNLAKQKETYNSARNGTLDSTPGIFAADQINKSYGAQRQQVASDALSATDALKNTVAQQKTNLYALNSSAADPTLASSNAAAAAGAIPSTPQFSQLGDLFGNLVNAGSAYAAGASKNNAQGYGTAFQAGSGLPGGSGSGKVVS